MRNKNSVYIKNFLVPSFFFAGAAGVGTGFVIFLFKFCASYVIGFSEKMYGIVRENAVYLPILILAAALIGCISAFILKKVPDARGGGIPTAIAILRGLVSFSWLKSIIFVFVSAMVTYLGGVPLGNEGPSVQMGTAVGRGVVRNHPAWSRYIMTGGASAGFAAATGAPLTGMFFAFEEAQRRFSPMIFLVSAVASLSSSVTMKALCDISDMQYSMFHFEMETVLPMKYYWTAIIVGVVVGLSAAVFTKAYGIIRKFVKVTLGKLPYTLKIVLIFVLVSVVGFISAECIGSGHHLVDELLLGHGTWYLLVIFFSIRAVLLLIANNSDITGGLFVPTLALGALIGALCGKFFVFTGILPEEYYSVIVLVGISAFLGSSSRTPLMAICFALEALSGLENILPIGIGITLSYLTIESLGITAFSDTVIEAKTEAEHEGKTAQVVDIKVRVMEGAFIVGKEIRDILWPPTCVITSVQKPAFAEHGPPTVGVGDILQVHYQTYAPKDTLSYIESMVGKQKDDIKVTVHTAKKNDQVPEI